MTIISSAFYISNVTDKLFPLLSTLRELRAGLPLWRGLRGGELARIYVISRTKMSGLVGTEIGEDKLLVEAVDS